MESEQLEKRVQWLDDERRKDKNTIAQFEERILTLERKLAAAELENANLNGEITRLNTIMGRMDDFDSALALLRKEFGKQISDQEKNSQLRDDEIISVLKAEIGTYEKPIYDIRKELEVVGDLKREIQVRIAEENRLSRGIDELKVRLADLNRNEEEQSRVYRLLEDGRRQDTKRLTDQQGELVALRKRTDEHRGRIDITDTTVRKLETRLNELILAEQERSDAQVAFQEKQALAEVERDAIWKAWKTRFETIEKQSIDVESQLQALDATYITVRRTREAVDDLMQRVERRINEVAEIQRLAEDRFRQEWTTFKADDQKRWTNYTLSQDEQRSEISRRFERITDRITFVEDSIQDIQDMLQYINKLNAQSLQSLMSSIHDWTSGYERTSGVAR